MNSIVISLIVLLSVFAGSLLGMLLRKRLPQHHLGAESKDAVKLGTGLIGTMAALLLGLLVASAKSSFDNQKSEVTQMAAKIVFIDRALALYGPDASDAREKLKVAVTHVIEQMWPEQASRAALLDPTAAHGELPYIAMQKLTPKNEQQSTAKSTALSLAVDVGQMRWHLMEEQSDSSISVPFLVVVIFWLTVVFVSFGLFSPPNATVICTLLLSAVSVAGAFFLVLELDSPFAGLLKISNSPMYSALNHMGK